MRSNAGMATRRRDVDLRPQLELWLGLDALSCGEAGVGHLGVLSGAVWHAAHWPGHIKRHAPLSHLAGDGGFGQVRSLGCGLERLTWLMRGGSRGCYGCVCHPALGGH